MLVIKIGNAFIDIDKNVFNNILEMQEIIVPYAWHSFCISIDLVETTVKLYHNDHIQLVQKFSIQHVDKEGLSKLMTKGHLGGPKFVGILTDFQMFGKVRSEDFIYEWTSCQIKVGIQNHMKTHILITLKCCRKLVTCTLCTHRRLKE